jgi:alpha-glucosidase
MVFTLNFTLFKCLNRASRLSILCFVALSVSSFAQKEVALSSPNGNIKLSFSKKQHPCLAYNLIVNTNKIIDFSPLGFEIDSIHQSEKWSIIKIHRKTVNTFWKPRWGKRAKVKEHYNEIIFELKNSNNQFKHYLNIEARAYDDGIAFRYVIPQKSSYASSSSKELTEFRFAQNYTSWFYNKEYPNIGPEKLMESDGIRLPPMTIKAENDLYFAIHEADLRFGEPLTLNAKRNSNTFTIHSKPGVLTQGYQSAWRVILIGKTAGSLIDSHLIELLNPDSVGDFSWVKPGVSVWDWRIDGAKIDGFTYGMNYESWVRMIDFAALNHIQSLILDANWYGPEHETDSNPLDYQKSQDVIKIIQYGKQKNVGVWLYLNDVGGRKYPIEKTLEQYSNWGASGIKYGFMNGTPQEKNEWTRKITALCAKNKLLCNFHDDPVHPYGQMRTYPNALTREFCHSQLDAHRVFIPKTFVTSVFVNMIAGPIDMDNGMFDLRQGNTTRIDENKPVPSTLVSEAARTLIVFSGVTVLPDIPEFYNKYPDLLKFISLQTMPWQESKTLSGEIGEYIVMARKSSKNVWLVGAANNETARTIDIPMSFLSSGNYKVTLIQDGENADYLTNREVFKVEKMTVTPTQKIKVRLAPGGGSCLIIKRI